MSNIRKFFTAPKEMKLVEFDYQQLEVRVLAALSKDKTLIKDLKEGIDMHCMSLVLLSDGIYDKILKAYKSGDEVIAFERKKAKRVSFLVQYGGGARTASEQTGVPLQLVQNYINKYNDRYKGVVQFNSNVSTSVHRTRCSSVNKTARGNPAGAGFWKAPTGRLFGFTEQDSPAWASTTQSFSPTQIKNYPTQGTGWDIVQAMLAHLMDLCYTDFPNVQFCNTVHDSLMFYVPEEEVHDFIKYAEWELSRVAHVSYTLWGWDTSEVDFPVDAKIGDNWLNLSNYKEPENASND